MLTCGAPEPMVRSISVPECPNNLASRPSLSNSVTNFLACKSVVSLALFISIVAGVSVSALRARGWLPCFPSPNTTRNDSVFKVRDWPSWRESRTVPPLVVIIRMIFCGAMASSTCPLEKWSVPAGASRVPSTWLSATNFSIQPAELRNASNWLAETVVFPPDPAE